MKNHVLAILILLILGVGYVVFMKSESDNTSQLSVQTSPSGTLHAIETVNKKARFGVFTRGIKRIFTASMYHDQSPDVYIQASDPGEIVVTKERITWDDFFKTLPFSVTADCLITGTKETYCTNDTEKLTFYLNGVIDKHTLKKEVRNGDVLLISYGTSNEEGLASQFAQID